MKRWKEAAYRTYVSGHTAVSSGPETLARITSQFPVWQRYYGDLLPERRDAAILDCGAGSGAMVYWLTACGYRDVHGIDGSAEQVAEARRLGISHVELADARKFLAASTRRYDCIIALDFIEHFSKSEALEMLGAWRAALVPGGTLILKTPSGESPFAARYRYLDFSHEIMFTRSSLHHALTIAGFRDIVFRPTGPVVHGAASFVRYVIWQVAAAFLRILLVAESGSGDGILTENMIAAARAPEDRS